MFLWTSAHKDLFESVFNSFGYIPRSWTAESIRVQCLTSGVSIKLFSLWQHFIFPPSMKLFPNPPHPCQHLFSVFLNTAMLVSVKWHLIVLLICIYLTTNDVQHLFHVFFHLCIFFEKMCQVLCPFFKLGTCLSVVEL